MCVNIHALNISINQLFVKKMHYILVIEVMSKCILCKSKCVNVNSVCYERPADTKTTRSKLRTW